MSEYLSYLQQRHPLSYPYRRWLLYPVYRALLPGRGIDVGCGLGEFLQRTNRFVGVDPDTEIVAHAAARGLPASVGSATALPFGDASFDAALLDNVLEHLDEETAALREIRRVLRPGGRLLVVVPNHLGYARDATHRRYWDEKNLPAAMEQAGYRVRRKMHYPIPFKVLGNKVWPYNTYLVLGEKEG